MVKRKINILNIIEVLAAVFFLYTALVLTAPAAVKTDYQKKTRELAENLHKLRTGIALYSLKNNGQIPGADSKSNEFDSNDFINALKSSSCGLTNLDSMPENPFNKP